MTSHAAKLKLIHAYKYLEGLSYLPANPGALAEWRDAYDRQARQRLYMMAHSLEAGRMHYCRRCKQMWEVRRNPQQTA